jgi:hypothetical protein
MSLIQYISGVSLTDARRVKIKQFDCPEYYKDEMKSSFSFINALIIEIAFLFTLLMNVGNMVLEKQTKMKVKKKSSLLQRERWRTINKFDFRCVFKGVLGNRGYQVVHFMVDQHASLLLGLLLVKHFDHRDWHNRIEAPHY